MLYHFCPIFSLKMYYNTRTCKEGLPLELNIINTWDFIVVVDQLGCYMNQGEKMFRDAWIVENPNTFFLLSVIGLMSENDLLDKEKQILLIIKFLLYSLNSFSIESDPQAYRDEYH